MNDSNLLTVAVCFQRLTATQKNSYNIYDNTGKRIEITDLKAALNQVRYFVGLRHTDPEYNVLDEQLLNYWSDVLTKLEELEKTTLNNQKKQ